MPTKTKTMPPVHPPTELFEPVTRINDIVRGRRAITADTALRLARYFGTTPQFWINLQSNYALELAQDARA
jgi:addiction module HigA family antidote